MGVTIICADVRDLPVRGPFHAILCDPPYGLEFMGKEWDAPWKTGMARYGFADGKFRNVGPVHGSKRNPVCLTCHKHKRGSDSCQCKVPEWDETPLDTSVAYQEYMTDVWRGLLALLHPGGFGMAFGGSRTYHRLACAIEDAGAVLHPMVGWAYGSGFPKATQISSQVDDNWAKENYGGWCECDDQESE